MLIAKYGNGSIEQIEEFEIRNKILLEENYKNFLLKYNGGDTPKTILIKGKRKEIVRCLYGINTKNSIEEHMKNFESKSCMPIGQDTWGNYYAIGVKEDNKGQIFFCDHEKGYKDMKIADSIIEFFSMCKSEKIGHVRTIEERKKAVIAAENWSKITEKTIEGWQKEIDKYANINQEEVLI